MSTYLFVCNEEETEDESCVAMAVNAASNRTHINNVQFADIMYDWLIIANYLLKQIQ